MEDNKRSYYNAEGKLVLPEVTLCAMDSVQVKATLKAMEYSMKEIVFADAVIITDKRPLSMPKGIRYEHIDKLCNIDDFNYKTVYDLGDYIHTQFALLVHYDGFVVHPEKWRDEFLDYDYIAMAASKTGGYHYLPGYLREHLPCGKQCGNPQQTSYGLSEKSGSAVGRGKRVL